VFDAARIRLRRRPAAAENPGVRPFSRLAPALLACALASLAVAGPAGAEQVFSPRSVWNTPVSASTALASNSAAVVTEVRRQVLAYGQWINTWQYSVPVYTVAARQRRVQVTLDATDQTLEHDFASVPLPSDARPAAGSDGHLTVYQPSRDTLWDFWKLSKGADGWHALWGGRMRHVSTSLGSFPAPYGATGTGLPLLGGLMRMQELQDGRIDHALALAIPRTKASEFVSPATRSDGNATWSSAPPEGTHLRLDPAVDIEALDLPPVTRAIALAAQRYGIIIRDGAGTVTFYAEDPSRTGSNPYPALFGGDYPSHLLLKFPWSRLQVLAPPLAPSSR
jgi:hypothetical protein